MTHHFKEHLNVKELIEQYNPSWILELGAGSGQNTRNLLDTGKEVTVITDGFLPDIPLLKADEAEGFLIWICGISYLEIPHLRNVEFCVLDTDHNGWTLRREMEELEKVMAPGGILCIHDTETFGQTNGVMQEYVCRVPYPKEIEQCELLYGEAWKREGWTLIRESKESNGAVALQWRKI